MSNGWMMHFFGRKWISCRTTRRGRFSYTACPPKTKWIMTTYPSKKSKGENSACSTVGAPSWKSWRKASPAPKFPRRNGTPFRISAKPRCIMSLMCWWFICSTAWDASRTKRPLYLNGLWNTESKCGAPEKGSRKSKTKPTGCSITSDFGKRRANHTKRKNA